MKSIHTTSLLTFLFSIIFISISWAQTWTQLPLDGCGRSSLQIVPSDTNTIYRFTEARGVWKSEDGGLSWYEVNNGLPVVAPDTNYHNTTSQGDYPYPSTLRIHPLQHEKLWVRFRSSSFYRSDDAGAGWYSTKIDFPETFQPQFIEFYGTNRDTLFVGGAGGLYRSDDGGANWSLVSTAPNGEDVTLSALSVDPQDSLHLLLGCSELPETYFTGGLYESRDGGATWSLLSDYFTFYSITFDPQNSLHYWAVVYNAYGSYELRESTDGGVNWDYPDLPGYDYINSFYDEHDALYMIVVVDNYTSIDLVILRSFDNGSTWEEFAESQPPGFFALFGNPLNPNTWYMTTEFGLCRSFDDGETWDVLPEQGLDASQFTSIVPHPTDPMVLYAGGITGLFKSVDGGGSWERIQVNSAERIAIDPTHPDTLYYGGYYHNGNDDALVIRRSYDGGENWQTIVDQPTETITSIVVDPLHSSTLFFGTARGALYRSDNYGVSWMAIDYGGVPWQDVCSLQFHPLDKDHLYMGQAGIYHTLDYGETWSHATLQDNASVVTFTIDKATGYYYASSTRNVYVAKQDGQGYGNLDVPLLPDSLVEDWHYIIDLVVNPANSDQLVLLTSLGLMQSEDRGETWTWLDETPPRANSIASSLDGSTLYVGTEHHGLWSSSNVLGVDEPSTRIISPVGFDLVSVYPNPFNSFTLITVSLEKSERIYLDIFNINGQRVYSSEPGILGAGKHSLVWNGTSNGRLVASGCYMIRVKSPSSSLTRKIILIR